MLSAQRPASSRTGSPRAQLDDSTASQRSTLCIRNIRQSVVYHLLFDGDVGRLTGAQLKAHIQGICNMPVEQQLLTYNGQPVHNTSTGYDLNLRDGAMLVLDSVARGGSGVADGGSAVVRGGSAEAPPLAPRSAADTSSYGVGGAAMTPAICHTLRV